ncbi:hypothetical protein, partial [Enterobacter intestinihominis]
AFVLAFFMSGGGYSITDLTVLKIFRPGKAHPPPANVWNRLHLTLYNLSLIKKNQPTRPYFVYGIAASALK